jgi:beta-alanine--pyruvate transaminase
VPVRPPPFFLRSFHGTVLGTWYSSCSCSTPRLLIFDEVITGFGRLEKGTASEFFDVAPDLITCAKGRTNAMVPTGAVLCKGKIYETLMDATPDDGSPTIELFHGYTYSCHPVAMAAGLAMLDYYRDHDLFDRAMRMSPYFKEGLHSMQGCRT